jgi:hypothetical protein
MDDGRLLVFFFAGVADVVGLECVAGACDAGGLCEIFTATGPISPLVGAWTEARPPRFTSREAWVVFPTTPGLTLTGTNLFACAVAGTVTTDENDTGF